MSIDWDKAIDHLNAGWCKETYGDGKGRVCLVGALMKAGVDTVEIYASPLVGIIREHFPERLGAGRITRFNDHPDTTLDDVILVCEKARAEG